jgi:serralysin
MRAFSFLVIVIGILTATQALAQTAAAIPFAVMPSTLVGAPCGPSPGAPTGGKTYYVSRKGNNLNNGLSPSTAFKTVGYAFTKYFLKPGDVVLVAPGTYAESVTLKTPGAPGACITLMGMPGQARPVVSWRNDRSATINVWAPYVRVSGLAVTHPEPHLIPTKRANSANSAIDAHSQYKADLNGVLRPTVHHVQIDNNVTYGSGCGGVTFEGTDYVLAYGNTVYGNAFSDAGHCSGINIYEAMNLDSAPGYHNYILDNFTYGNTNLYPVPGRTYTTDENGIIIDDFRNFQAKARSPSTPFIPYTGQTLIFGNVIFGNGGHGVEIYSSDYVDILNNVSYQNLNDPLMQGYPTYAGGELDVEYSGNIRVENNIAIAASSSLQVLGQIGAAVDQASNYWNYNIVDVGFLALGNSNAGDANAGSLYGVDPKFIKPSTNPTGAAQNFRLHAGSPAKNAGIPLGLRLTDINGWTVSAKAQTINIGASLQ